MSDVIDPPRIWLSPACAKCIRTADRTWCESPQDNCEDCGAKWVEYRVSKAREVGREP